jgi:hypothetical protein
MAACIASFVCTPNHCTYNHCTYQYKTINFLICLDVTRVFSQLVAADESTNKVSIPKAHDDEGRFLFGLFRAIFLMSTSALPS